MKKYPHGITLAAVCNAIEAYKAHEDNVPETGIIKAFEVLLADSDLGNKLQALAAENANIKACVEMHAAGFKICPACSHQDECETDDVVWMVREATPATDAYLNSVRAEGVEMYGNVTIAIGKEQEDVAIVYAGKQALLYAAQLRAGKDGE